MNKWLLLTVLVALAGAGAGLVFFGRDRGAAGSDLPPPMQALQRHFAAAGIDTQTGLARSGARERLRHNVQFELRGSQQWFSVQWFENADAAQAYLGILRQYPASAAALANGEFVLSLNDGWTVTDPMTQRIRAAFTAFDAAAAVGSVPPR